MSMSIGWITSKFTYVCDGIFQLWTIDSISFSSYFLSFKHWKQISHVQVVKSQFTVCSLFSVVSVVYSLLIVCRERNSLDRCCDDYNVFCIRVHSGPQQISFHHRWVGWYRAMERRIRKFITKGKIQFYFYSYLRISHRLSQHIFSTTSWPSEVKFLKNLRGIILEEFEWV